MTVGRQAIPRASSSCMVANAALITARWCPTRRASQVIGLATTAGLPWAVAPIIWLKPVVNMEGWYCSRASSSQLAARPSWSHRRLSGASERAARVALRRSGQGAFPVTALSVIAVFPS